ncbi:gamma subunit of the F1 sector of mitochondrial F1F0 ATP synthase [Nadsonia fulvescens var. elongata DSM 6958]|uniref:ATP synthase subunit gamma n=1 Tax=Nadsonia fulvescens var. elongata DSM 6958 TaxID=857566 RepID=A0A1E3PPT9_9ASCO|nr:gamma subunit of the F1 sector of mitochondrial F1F0 ATP synthase [Nadsonia fulvescens var. elongata DSM 6958]
MFALRTAAASGSIRTSTRSYATLREIEIRLKSIKNIEKITNTMKIVASTKLTKAQRAMEISRVYGTSNDAVYKNAGTVIAEEAPKKLVVILSSDKGLCGSVHSQIAKAARLYLKSNPESDVVAVGEKIKAQISRSHAKNLVLSFASIGKDAPTFNEAALIATEIQSLGSAYDDIQIFYNKFVSGVSFEPSHKPAFSQSTIENSPSFGTFELEEEVVGNLAEFSLANTIYSALAEGHASEVSARRNAMDNASKNARDMISKYSILYNRTRQAVITNELVDIVTGASALE